jgi:hypothetical protein
MSIAAAAAELRARESTMSDGHPVMAPLADALAQTLRADGVYRSDDVAAAYIAVMKDSPLATSSPFWRVTRGVRKPLVFLARGVTTLRGFEMRVSKERGGSDYEDPAAAEPLPDQVIVGIDLYFRAAAIACVPDPVLRAAAVLREAAWFGCGDAVFGLCAFVEALAAPTAIGAGRVAADMRTTAHAASAGRAAPSGAFIGDARLSRTANRAFHVDGVLAAIARGASSAPCECVPASQSIADAVLAAVAGAVAARHARGV